MKRLFTWTACFACLLTCVSLRAQTRQVSLSDCIAIAMENNPDMMVSREDYKKARAQYEMARSENRIQISADVKSNAYELPYNRIKKDGTVKTDSYRSLGLFAGSTVSYKLFDLTRSKREKSALMGIDLAGLNNEKMRSSIVLNVKSAYYTYMLARESVSLQDELRKKNRQKLEKTRLFYKNGQRPILDVTKAEVDLASSELEYKKTQHQLNIARSNLISAMGLSESEIEILPSVAVEMPAVKLGIEQLMTIAQDHYPELRAVRLNKEIQKYNIEVERALRYPVVDVFASFGFENKDLLWYKDKENKVGQDLGGKWDIAPMFGVTARVPLYTGGMITARIDAAKAEYYKSYYNEKKMLSSMRVAISNYHQQLSELLKQVELSNLMKANAEKHLALAQKSYEGGVGSQLALQDAETSVLSAVLSEKKARYEYLITLAKLSNAVGVGEEDLCAK